MSLLNDYLNGYTEKLARENPDDPREIKIDQDHFYKIIKDIEVQAINPYSQFVNLRRQLNSY